MIYLAVLTLFVTVSQQQFKSINRITNIKLSSGQQNEGTLSFLRRYFPGSQSRDDGRSGGKTSA